MDLKYFICGIDSDSIDSTCSHFRLKHGLFDVKLLVLECCLPKCTEKLNSYKSFREHLRSSHDSLHYVSNTNITTQKKMRVNENGESSVIGNKAVNLRNKGTSILQPINGNSAVRDDIPKDQNTGTVCGEKQFDDYENCFINLDASSFTKTDIDKIVEESSKMLHQVLKDFTEICSDAPPFIVKKIEDYVNEKKIRMENVATKYKRNKLISTQAGIVMPNLAPVGERYDQIRYRKTGIYKTIPVTCKMAYIPNLETIESVLLNKSVWQEISKTHINQNG